MARRRLTLYRRVSTHSPRSGTGIHVRKPCKCRRATASDANVIPSAPDLMQTVQIAHGPTKRATPSTVGAGKLGAMCGRYANARRDADLIDAFRIEDVRGPELEPSWNVAPMQNVRIVLERAPKDEPEKKQRQLNTSRWGGWSPRGRRTRPSARR